MTDRAAPLTADAARRRRRGARIAAYGDRAPELTSGSHLAPDDDVRDQAARRRRAARGTATTLPLRGHDVRGEGQHRRRRPPDHRRVPRVRLGPSGRRRWSSGSSTPARSSSARPTSTSSPPAWSAPAHRTTASCAQPPRPRVHRRRLQLRVGGGGRPRAGRLALGTDTAGSGRVPGGVQRHRRAEAHPRAAQHPAAWSRRAELRLRVDCSRPRVPTPRACGGVADPSGCVLGRGPDHHAGRSAPRAGLVRRSDGRAASMPRSRGCRGRRRAGELDLDAVSRGGRLLYGGPLVAERAAASASFAAAHPARGPDRATIVSAARGPGDRRGARLRAARAFGDAPAAPGTASTPSCCRPSPAPARRRGAPRSVRAQRRPGPLHELREPAGPVRGLGACWPPGRNGSAPRSACPWWRRRRSTASCSRWRRSEARAADLAGAAPDRLAVVGAHLSGHAAEPPAPRPRRSTGRGDHDGPRLPAVGIISTKPGPRDGAGAARWRGNRIGGLGARRTWPRGIRAPGARAARPSGRWSRRRFHVVLGFLCEPHTLSRRPRHHLVRRLARLPGAMNPGPQHQGKDQWATVARWSCTDRTALEPSPTAAATRLIEPLQHVADGEHAGGSTSRAAANHHAANRGPPRDRVGERTVGEDEPLERRARTFPCNQPVAGTAPMKQKRPEHPIVASLAGRKCARG